jgi:magnesium transporter
MVYPYRIQDGKLMESPGEGASILLYINPDEFERKYLVDDMKIDEHNLLSSLDPDEVSRIEYEPDHMVLIIKRPKNYSTEDNYLFKISSMGFFAFSNRLVITMSEDVGIFKGKIFNKILSLNDVMLKIIFSIISHFFGHLKVINMISDSLEKKISTSMENKYLTNMFSLEKSLVYYLNAINANSMVFDKLKLNSAKLGFNEDNREFLDDILIENTQCYRQSEIYANILASLMDARASIVNNNLNILMKTLNIITISIMVPTFVVSAFSMNVTIPFKSHPLAFWIILGIGVTALIIFIMAYTLFYSFRRK